MELTHFFSQKVELLFICAMIFVQYNTYLVPTMPEMVIVADDSSKQNTYSVFKELIFKSEISVCLKKKIQKG